MKLDKKNKKKLDNKNFKFDNKNFKSDNKNRINKIFLSIQSSLEI